MNISPCIRVRLCSDGSFDSRRHQDDYWFQNYAWVSSPRAKCIIQGPQHPEWCLIWLTFLVYMAVQLDMDIPTFPKHNAIQKKQAAILYNTEVSDHILLTSEDLTNLSLAAITSTRMLKEQKNIRLFRDIVTRKQTGKNGFLQCYEIILFHPRIETIKASCYRHCKVEFDPELL